MTGQDTKVLAEWAAKQLRRLSITRSGESMMVHTPAAYTWASEEVVEAALRLDLPEAEDGPGTLAEAIAEAAYLGAKVGHVVSRHLLETITDAAIAAIKANPALADLKRVGPYKLARDGSTMDPYDSDAYLFRFDRFGRDNHLGGPDD